MRFEEKRATLADGTIIALRSPTQADAQTALDYLQKTTEETPFLTCEVGERTLTPEQEAAWLQARLDEPRGMQIGAFKDGVLIGMTGFSPSVPFRRGAHRATLGIAIVKDYWHLGLGTMLMREAISAVQRLGYEKLELAAVGTNARALRLYERYGFTTYGVNKNAFKYPDGSYADEVLMALDLMVE